MARYIIVALMLLGVAGCTDQDIPTEPTTAAQAPALHRDPEGNYFARLTPARSTSLILDASIYDGQDVYVEFSVRYRGNFNGEGHAYGRYMTWNWKLHATYSYYSYDPSQAGNPGQREQFNFPRFNLADGEWHTVRFRRFQNHASFTVDGLKTVYTITPYIPGGPDNRVVGFMSMDADIDDLMICVDGKRVGWWDFEGNFENEMRRDGYTFTGFTIMPY